MAVLAALFLVDGAWAHGGAFRPPPGGKSGPPDPSPPGGGGGPSTPGGGGGGGSGAPSTPGRTRKQPSVNPWESWWHLNRDVHLRVRERMLEREVITGRSKRTDLFDRRSVREQVLEPEVMKALRDREAKVRAAAAIVAGKLGFTRAVPLLERMFERDKVKEVRESCVLGLLLLRDPARTEMFRRMALEDRESRRIRGFAVLGLGFLKDRDFLEKLLRVDGVRIRGSRTAVKDVRACAALALGYGGDPRSMTGLLAVTMDDRAPRRARGFAAASLGRLGTPLALPEVMRLLKSRTTLNEVRYGAAIAAGHLVRPAEERLVDELARRADRDKQLGVRGLALLSLGRIGGPRARDHLVASLKDNAQVAMRGFHYLALGLTRDAKAGPVLLAEFERLSQNNDRAACAIGLGLLEYRPAAPVLRKEVERGNMAFAPHGMLALGMLDDRKAIPIIEDLLRKRDPNMRREGVIALALLRQSAAVPFLVELLESSTSWYTRGSVAQAIGLVGTDKAVEPLLRIYRDRRRQGEERAVALAALGRLADPEPVPLLSRLAVDLNPYVIVDAVAEALTIL